MSVEWPVEYKKELLLGNLSKSVAICSLWSERNFVGGQVGLENVALVGNLYSHGPGIEGIVRNILSNPSIRTVVITGKDKTQSAETLITFMSGGIKRTDIGLTIDRSEKIAEDVLPPGRRTIDGELPLDQLDLLRRNVEIIDLRSSSWEDVRNRVLATPYKSPFSEPKVFPRSEVKIEVLRGEDIGFVFRGSDPEKVWMEILRTVRQFGVRAESRYSKSTQEVLNVTAIIDNPVEAASEDIRIYAKQLIEGQKLDKDDTYAYGHRMRVQKGDQIAAVIKKLKADPIGRGYLVDLWDVASDFFGDSANPPCMTQVWFRVFDERLVANFYYRSHDIANAWIKNALGDRLLQSYVANEVGISLGPTSIISASAHIYEQDFLQVDGILKGRENRWKFSEDPRGNFVITAENGEINVRHENSSGAVNILKGKSAEKLYKKIWEMGLISLIDHALYIGHVLSKAEEASKKGSTFDQDMA